MMFLDVPMMWWLGVARAAPRLHPPRISSAIGYGDDRLASMIRITPSIAIDESEIEESFIRSPGPGGQNVNKVASAVQLRFDVRASKSLPPPVRLRLERLAGSRLTRQGVLILVARDHRSQERNRRAALDRLVGLIR